MDSFCGCLSVNLQSFFFSEAFCRRSKQRRSSRYAFINFTSEQAAKRFQKRHTWQQKFIQQNIRWISCEGSNAMLTGGMVHLL